MRNIVAEAGTVLAPDGRPAFLHALEGNWYEGSRWSPNRSYIWFPVQDAKKDLDKFTRSELSKHARYLWKNSPLIRGVIERLVTISVGSGFYPVFKSSSPEWNTRAKKAWRKKCRNIHLGPKCSMLDYQRAVARARFVDGECFSLKTADETVEYDSRVQGLEAERVCGGKDPSSDGLLLNKQGIVTGYYVKGVEAPYAAEHVIHHFTPNRLGQYRGETVLAAAINTARDVDDILALEKLAVKDASAKKDIIKTASGQLDAEAFRSLRFSQVATPMSLPADDNAKNDYYKVALGPESVVLRRGDEYTPYTPARPGSAWQGFMDFLAMTICLSTGFPPSTILPIDVGGTDIRRDLDIAQKVADPIQLDIAAELDEIVDYFIEGEIQDGELRKGVPADWDNRGWHFPAKINVDRQQAQQDRADVQSGLMSREEYHGRFSEDAEEVDATIIAEAKRRKDMISKAGFKDLKEFVQIMSLDGKMFQVNEQQKPNETP